MITNSVHTIKEDVKETEEDALSKAISLYGERVHSLNQDCWEALLIATYGLVSRLYEEWAKQEGSLKEHFKGVVK